MHVCVLIKTSLKWYGSYDSHLLFSVMNEATEQEICCCCVSYRTSDLKLFLVVFFHSSSRPMLAQLCDPQYVQAGK